MRNVCQLLFTLILVMQATLSELPPRRRIPLKYRDPSGEADPRWICPLDLCKKCKTAEEITAPGVGFALEIGYATSVIRYHDKTYRLVARIDGDNAYKALLKSYVKGTANRPPSDSFTTPSGMLEYISYQAKRRLKKQLGLAATPEAAIIANLLSSLKERTEVILGKPITSAILVSPETVGLNQEEVDDVFDYLSIKNISDWPGPVCSALAAYNGYGYGLCRKYFDQYECAKETASWPDRHVLHLHLSPDDLSGAIIATYISTAEKSFTDLELGTDNWMQEQRQQKHQPSSEEYWKAVTSRIRTFITSNDRIFRRPAGRISRLILTGTSASDEHFKTAIKAALDGLVSEPDYEEMINVMSKDDGDEMASTEFIYATAKGAAEKAKRTLESPDDCEECDKCKELRKRLEEDYADHEGDGDKEEL